MVNSKPLREHDKSGDMGAAWLVRNEAGSGGFRLRRHRPGDRLPGGPVSQHFPPALAIPTSPRWNSAWYWKLRAVLGLQKGEFNTTDGYLPQDQIKRLRQVDSVQILEAESL